MNHSYAHRAFGLVWHSDTPLARFTAAEFSERPDVVVTRRNLLRDRGPGTPMNSGIIYHDGFGFSADRITFDMFEGSRIEWASADLEALPMAFYSTVTALLLAWRGKVPLHASAVAIAGKGVIVCGVSGAGKSSLANALVACGGQLISDDLTVLEARADDGVPVLWPGRPAIRLLPSEADRNLPLDPLGKVGVEPVQVAQREAVPAATLVVLRRLPIIDEPVEKIAMLRMQLFRPAWMQVLPGGGSRAATILHAGTRLQMLTMPPAGDVAGEPVEERAAALLKRLG